MFFIIGYKTCFLMFFYSHIDVFYNYVLYHTIPDLRKTTAELQWLPGGWKLCCAILCTTVSAYTCSDLGLNLCFFCIFLVTRASLVVFGISFFLSFVYSVFFLSVFCWLSLVIITSAVECMERRLWNDVFCVKWNVTVLTHSQSQHLKNNYTVM